MVQNNLTKSEWQDYQFLKRAFRYSPQNRISLEETLRFQHLQLNHP
jgi:hypothetical protein